MIPHRLRLLGLSELTDDKGSIVHFPTKNTLLVLVVLVHAKGRMLLRSKVAETVWPDVTEKAARDSLRAALSSLRKYLPALAIRSDVEWVGLDSSTIECDWREFKDHRDYSGEFMPGFTHDWVVDQRIALRTRAAESAMECARLEWQADRRLNAIQLVTRACEIDAWNQEAAKLRVQYLESNGDQVSSLKVGDEFRNRMLKDLGLLPTVRQNPPQTYTKHPLFESAEWLLDHHPKDAVAMLAATHHHWPMMPVEPAAKLHARALGVRDSSPSERNILYAQFTQLKVMAGKLTHLAEAEKALSLASDSHEYFVAARLAGALSYDRLSRGDFVQSERYAWMASTFAERTKQPDFHAEIDIDLSIILLHVGKASQSNRLYSDLEDRVETHCSAQKIAGYTILNVDHLLNEGSFDQAATRLQRARRIFESGGTGRMLQWVLMSEGSLYEHLGEYYTARNKFQEIRQIGSEIGGQAVIAMANERLAQVECDLNEFGMAAEALGRATAFRRELGIVRSIAERIDVRKTKQILSERLDARELRAAYARSASAKLS